MSTFYPAVLAQVEYACATLGFIKSILRAVLPSLARDKGILGTKDEFRAQIDSALVALDHHEATETEYRLAVANAACGEVSKLCELLTEACRCVGFGDVAKRYLDPRRFVLLLLKRDTEKLDALTAAVKAGDGSVGRMLMRIGAILDGHVADYDEMDAAAKRKATRDTKKIITEVKTLARKFDEGRAEIVEHVDAVAEKVDNARLRDRRGRRAKYSEAARTACLSCWAAAQANAAVRNSTNTRVTHESAFRYFARQLAQHGIDSVKKFKTVLHSAQSLECNHRKKALDAKSRRRAQKAATGDTNTKRKNFDIIHAMRTRVRNAVALSLAIAGAVASPLRSDAFSRKSLTPPSLPRSVLRAA